VSNLRLNTTQLAQGRVPLDWDILEEGDAAVIQVIYAGDDTADVDIEGVIEGQALVSLRQYPHKLQRPEEQLSRGNWRGYATGIVFSAVGVAWLCINARLLVKKWRWPMFANAVLAVTLIIFAGLSIYEAARVCEPPFGF